MHQSAASDDSLECYNALACKAWRERPVMSFSNEDDDPCCLLLRILKVYRIAITLRIHSVYVQEVSQNRRSAGGDDCDYENKEKRIVCIVSIKKGYFPEG